MAFRDSAAFGKRQEFVVIAELLRRGFDVYLTLVDFQQIDCVVRKEISGKPEPVYLDIQIKARSKQCNPKNAGTFAPLEVKKPRPNFFFIFYSEQTDCFWVVPTLDLIKKANKIKTGPSAGRYRIVFTNLSRKTGKPVPRPKFEDYRDNFDLLKEYPKA